MPSSLPATLLSLVRKELLRPARTPKPGDDALRFSHALIRDAAYAEIPKATRAELHERFAGWLEANRGKPELVGYHLEQAFRCGAIRQEILFVFCDEIYVFLDMALGHAAS